MSFIPKPYEIYKHFKGNLYQILALAEHSETGEQLVIYQALYGEFKIYARELSMFTSLVDKEKYPNVNQEYRFELQNCETMKSEMKVGNVLESMSNTVEMTVTKQPIQEQSQDLAEELTLDPALVEFLDAETYEQRLNILTGLHHRITDEMITTMAIACDVEVEEGTLEERYSELKNCLLTLDKYECTRLR